MQNFIRTIALLGVVTVACQPNSKKEAVTEKIDYRPAYHFTPPQNWLNDPNGLVYHDGEYHLFYQHNPFGMKWGHMSWGHAVSKDLLRWEHLPVAIPEFTEGGKTTAIFSGSTVVDEGNKNGLCLPGTKDCLVAIYTGNVTAGDKHLAQYQNLAYSADRGRTWTQYAKNPIVDIGSKEFRDPNVFWYAPRKKWVMSTVKATEHRAAFYESKDLKTWRLMSHFGPVGDTTKVWECPALMPVPIENESGRPSGGKSKWVLFISAGHPQSGYVGMQYFVGDFDGTNFKLDPAHPKPIATAASNRFAGSVVDCGKDYYAAIQFNGLPAGQTGPLMVGWLNNWAYANDLPTKPFNGVYSVPRQISLRRTAAGLQLIQQPVAELRKVEQPAFSIKNQAIDGRYEVPFTGDAFDLELTLKPGTAKTVLLALFESEGERTVLRYDVARQELAFDRTQSGNVAFHPQFSSVETAKVALKDGSLKLRLLADKCVVEVFAQDGEATITDLVFPTKNEGKISLTAEGGSAQLQTLQINRITLQTP